MLLVALPFVALSCVLGILTIEFLLSEEETQENRRRFVLQRQREARVDSGARARKLLLQTTEEVHQI